MATKTGYNVTLVNVMPEKFRCNLCYLLMRNPLQTIRGELACSLCYMTAYRKTDGKCPIDGETIKECETFPDKHTAKTILNLECVCANEGCQWKGVVETAEAHQDTCIVKTCLYCDKAVTVSVMYEHLRRCAAVCSPKECLYKTIGCKYKPTTSKDLKTHLSDAMFIHHALNVISIQSMKDQTCNMQHDNKIFMEEHQAIAQNRNKEMDADNKQESFCMDITQLKTSLDEVQKDVKYIKDAQNTDSINANQIDKINKSQELMSKRISELDLKQQLMENTSYNGRMLWKIDSYTTRTQQAVTGVVTALHSAPCLTEQYGYKFCCRLYLNGDGMGRNTHLSFFFVVMKSEYDNLLEWPFTQRVTFRLINFDNPNESLRETFLPDVNSSSFQKPCKQMNIAAGCPMFVSKEQLLSGGFIKDDCLYIETIVA